MVVVSIQLEATTDAGGIVLRRIRASRVQLIARCLWVKVKVSSILNYSYAK